MLTRLPGGGPNSHSALAEAFMLGLGQRGVLGTGVFVNPSEFVSVSNLTYIHGMSFYFEQGRRT